MAFTKLTAVLNKISTLPTLIKGQAAATKAAFDHDVNEVKDYVNDTLIPELELADSANVKLTGNQTVAGIKTFQSSPIVPTPTADMQTSTKKYVDDTDANRKTYVDEQIANQTPLNIQDNSITNAKLSNAAGQIKPQVSDMEISPKYPPSPLTAVVGDGTTDDITALQAIVNYCGINKRKLNMVDITCLISTTLFIPDNVDIDFGASGGIKTNSNINLIEFIGKNIKFEKGLFDVSGATGFTKAAWYFGLYGNESISCNNPKLKGPTVSVYDVDTVADLTTKNPVGGKAIHIYKPANNAYYMTTTTIKNLRTDGFGCGIEVYCPRQAGSLPFVTGNIFQGTIWAASRALNILQGSTKGFISGNDFNLITETGTNGSYHIIMGGDKNILKVNAYDVPNKRIKVAKDSLGIILDVFGQQASYIDDFGKYTKIISNSLDQYKEYPYYRKDSFNLDVNNKFSSVLFYGDATLANEYTQVKEEDVWCHKFDMTSTSTFFLDGLSSLIDGIAKKIVVTAKVKCADPDSISYTAQLESLTTAPQSTMLKTRYKYKVVSVSGTTIGLDSVDNLVVGDRFWVWGESYLGYYTNPNNYPCSIGDRKMTIESIDVGAKTVVVNTVSPGLTVVVGDVLSIYVSMGRYSSTLSGIHNTFTEKTFTIDLSGLNINKSGIYGHRLSFLFTSGNSNAKSIYVQSDIKVEVYTQESTSFTWNPGNLVDGAGETSAAITVTGAKFGDYVLVSAPYDLQGITCNAYVSATDTVKVRIQNETGLAVDLASGTWKVSLLK